VRYVHAEAGRAALFAGRPVRWSGERADGRGPLDPRMYLPPAQEWARDLDGRCAALRCTDDSVEVFSDPLGAYPLYERRAGRVAWVSNSPLALLLAAGPSPLDPAVLASVVGGGWSLDGHPVWSEIRRVPRGIVWTLGPGGVEHRHELLPVQRIADLYGAGMDEQRATRTLVALLEALGDWPGRPNVLPLTGGRDSRLILAAALRGGRPVDAATGGAPEHPDVIVARRLASVAGVPHRLLGAPASPPPPRAPERGAALVALQSGATATLADAAGFPTAPGEGDLELWHTGQGGEIARAYYPPVADGRRGSGAASLYRAFTGRRAWRREPLNDDGAAVISDSLSKWVGEQRDAGLHDRDLADSFYLLRRMGTWAGPTHGCVEWIRDSTSPLWSVRLLPDLVGLPADERAAEGFHRRLVGSLAPALGAVPFAEGGSWGESRAARRTAHTRRLLARASAEAGSRISRRAPRVDRSEDSAPDTGTELARAQLLVREWAAGQPDHPAWRVLDRRRVERLLSTDPGTLDTMSGYYLWRLSTVFAPGLPSGDPGPASGFPVSAP
jgi:hypothetical protein